MVLQQQDYQSTFDASRLTPGTRESLRALPKVELDQNLLETISEANFAALRKVYGARTQAHGNSHMPSYAHYFQQGIRTRRQIVEQLMTWPAHLYQITYDYLVNAAEQGVFYSEFRFNPLPFIKGTHFSLEDALQAIFQAMAAASQDTGIESRLLYSLEGVEHHLPDTLTQLFSNRPEQVIGVAMSLTSYHLLPTGILEYCRQQGFYITLDASDMNVDSARDYEALLGCDRISSAYRLQHLKGGELDQLAQALKHKNSIITASPLCTANGDSESNNQLAREEAITRLYRRDFVMHPIANHHTTSSTPTLDTWQFVFLHIECHTDDLLKLSLNGIDAAFVDDATRAKWKRQTITIFELLRDCLEEEEIGVKTALYGEKWIA